MTLTKREHLAGMAMQGMLTNPEGLSRMVKQGEKKGFNYLETIASVSVNYADALLAELERTSPPSA